MNDPGVITVVIPVFGHGPNLLRVVGALQHQKPAVGRIIISHSGDGDPTGQFEGQDNVTVLHSDERLWAAVARNRGFALADTVWVSFIDEDVIVDETWHASISAAIGQHLAACFVGSIGYAETGGYWGLSQWIIEFSALHPHRPAGYVQSGASANMTVNREVFESIGAFPRIRLAEDISAQALIRGLGEKIWFEPTVIGRHINLPGFRRFLKHNFDLGIYSAKFRIENGDTRGAIATRLPLFSLGLWFARLILIYKRLLRRGSPIGEALLHLPGALIGLIAHNAGFSQEAFAAKRRKG